MQPLMISLKTTLAIYNWKQEEEDKEKEKENHKDKKQAQHSGCTTGQTSPPGSAHRMICDRDLP
jgi:hypothetical protein